MKKYFRGHVDFRSGKEVELYQQRQDELLRRLDKHPNTRGALDLGLAADSTACDGLRELSREEGRSVRCGFRSILNWSVKMRRKSSIELAATDRCAGIQRRQHDARVRVGAESVGCVADGGMGEEKGTYTNYAGRVQITNRAVMPPGEAQPLHHHDGANAVDCRACQVSRDPAAIFEWISREVPAYAGLDYDAIGRHWVYRRLNREVLQ